MSKISKLKRIPWEVVRGVFFTGKKLLFPYGNYETDFILPNTTVQELKVILRKAGFISGEYFSQEYKGEDLNVVKPIYIDDEYGYYQLHVRAFEKSPERGDPYTEVDVHLELDPREPGQALPHLKHVNYSIEEGISMLEDILDNRDIEYKSK